MAFGKDGVKYKIVFDYDVQFFSWRGQGFYFKKGVPGYVPHWEIAQAVRRKCKILEFVGTPEQKLKYWHGGFDGV